MRGEEGDAVEGEGQEGARAPHQVQQPDERAAQAEVYGAAVHDDPVMALGGGDNDTTDRQVDR